MLGPGAEALLQHCLTRNVRKLSVGQVVYTAVCYDTGTMLDDGTLFRLGQDNFRWIGGCDQGGDWLREQAQGAWPQCVGPLVHRSAPQPLRPEGPNSRQVVGEIVWTPPARPTVQELGWFRFTIGAVGRAGRRVGAGLTYGLHR